MRRYKYNHHVSDHIQRVALIYGNGSHHNNGPQYQYSGNNAIYSPYMGI